MTRRREPTILCWTVPEAAESLRLSENLLREMVRSGQVRTIRWQSLTLIPTVELHRLVDEALTNGGSLPTVAVASPSHGSAAVVEGEATGAVGSESAAFPGVRHRGGEAPRAHSAAPISRRKPAVASAGSHEHAG